MVIKIYRLVLIFSKLLPGYCNLESCKDEIINQKTNNEPDGVFFIKQGIDNDDSHVQQQLKCCGGHIIANKYLRTPFGCLD